MFQYENEAKAVMNVLPKRLGRFSLEVATEKTRILPFGRYKGTKEDFDFLGFTHLNGRSHWGKYCVVHRTSKKKLKMKRQAAKTWLQKQLTKLWNKEYCFNYSITATQRKILKAFDLTPANIRDQAKLFAAELKSIDEGETKMAAAQ